jgi:hypothetical protein
MTSLSEPAASCANAGTAKAVDVKSTANAERILFF